MSRDQFASEIRQQLESCDAAAAEQRWHDAEKGYELLSRRLEESGDALGCARIQLRLGQVCEEQSRYDEAAEAHSRAEQLARELGDRELQATALHRLGHVLRMRDPDEALEMFRRSLDLAAAGSAADALSLAMIGQIDFTSGDRSGGLATMLKALDSLPETAAARNHLIEHVVYFGNRIERCEYEELVGRHISRDQLAEELLKPI